jgi:hypothetical protein
LALREIPIENTIAPGLHGIGPTSANASAARFVAVAVVAVVVRRRGSSLFSRRRFDPAECDAYLAGAERAASVHCESYTGARLVPTAECGDLLVELAIAREREVVVEHLRLLLLGHARAC